MLAQVTRVHEIFIDPLRVVVISRTRSIQTDRSRS